MNEKGYKQFQPRGRFYIVKEGNWCLVDDIDGSLVGFDTKAEATDAKKFAAQYVRVHGDIDLQSFPFSIDQPLSYADRGIDFEDAVTQRWGK